MLPSVVFGIIILVSLRKHKNTRPITAFISLESAYLCGFWLYHMIFLLKDGHESSPIIVAFALCANFCINCTFYEFLKMYILSGQDQAFSEY